MAVGASTDGSSDGGRWTVVGVCAVAAAALAVRFVDLGGRFAHWDEGRVGFWILDYVETGEFSYRPIIHGPFFHHVNPIVFDLFGTTDAAMRAVPALVSGLLPLSVLLLRDRFDPAELIALAFFLAFNPLLVYYGRFMRGDVLVGAFMFAAFVLFVRFVDARRYSHLLAGVAFAALGFTVKENAPVYVLCWLGGLAVYGYLHLFAAKTAGRDPVRSWLARRRERLAASSPAVGRRPDGGFGRGRADRETARRLLHGAGVVALCVLVFFVVFVAFYAPRGDAGVTVGTTMADPTQLPALLEEAIVGSYEEFYSLWGDGGQSEHPYLPYLEHLVRTLGAGALAVSLLAVAGFLVESVRDGGPRAVVVVAFLWGGASVFGYPIITDIKAPWAAVHVVLPWAIPAAVALGAVGRRGRDTLADADYASVGLAALVVLLATGVPAYVTYDTSFVRPTAESNDLVQYAQPSGDAHPEMAALERLAERNEGTDVVLYGRPLVEGSSIYQRPSCAGDDGWFESLPLPWYLERADAETACAQDLGELNEIDADGTPPVVITTLDHRSTLEERYPNYEVTVREMRLWGSKWAFFVDTSRLPADENPLAGVDTEPAVEDDSSAGAVNGSTGTGGLGGSGATSAVVDGTNASTAGPSPSPVEATDRLTATPASIHYG